MKVSSVGSRREKRECGEAATTLLAFTTRDGVDRRLAFTGLFNVSTV
jgi:hypothetical protein